MEQRKLHSSRLSEEIREQVSEFFNRESNKSSLITVTRVILSDSLKNASILITVYPIEKESDVMAFCKRRATDIRSYLQKHIKTHHIPFLDFQIDDGEKNRQKIDALLQ
tara:strand:+ start:528 stop:854 length:327 start_codon:yes stop_codon:yes gene_type:complete